MTYRVVVEPSSYSCCNMGDAAMLQVTVRRVSELLPGAEIQVVTARPDALQQLCPAAIPLDAEEAGIWLSSRSLVGGTLQRVSSSLGQGVRELERSVWFSAPGFMECGTRIKNVALGRSWGTSSKLREALSTANLVAVTGMGKITDPFEASAIDLLDKLEAALRAGVPVLAFGQGIGPVEKPELLARARKVLPRVHRIALREKRYSLPFLRSIGVPEDRIVVTGDDAIETAYRCRQESMGDAVGVNLRLAEYAEVHPVHMDKLRIVLQTAIQELRSYPLIVPISLSEHKGDTQSVQELLGPDNLELPTAITCPEDVMRLVARCRMVVTGSYHGAVFALAQGIPVIGLASSEYYRRKFGGLAEQFPGGCTTLDLDKMDDVKAVIQMFKDTWEAAARLRAPLRQCALEQIQASQAAYQHIAEVLGQPLVIA